MTHGVMLELAFITHSCAAQRRFSSSRNYRHELRAALLSDEDIYDFLLQVAALARVKAKSSLSRPDYQQA